MEKKDSKEETVKNKAMTEVNSSSNVLSFLSLTWIAVITNKQNPRRFADVLKICADVLLRCRFFFIPLFVEIV